MGDLPTGDAPHRRHRAHGRDATALRPFSAHHRLPGTGRGRADRAEGARYAGRRGAPHARRVPRLRDLPGRARRHASARHPLRRPAGDREDVPGEGDGQAGGRPIPVHLGDRTPVDVVRDDRVPDPIVLQGAPQGGAQGRGRDRLHRGDRCDRAVAGRRQLLVSGRHGALREQVHVLEHRRDGERAPDPDAVVRSAAPADPDPRQVPRVAERLSAGELAVQDARSRVPQHPADRRHQPGRLARHRAHATRSLRPAAVFRRAHPERAGGPGRLLPRAEEAPRAARRPGRPDAHRARVLRVHAGHDRAPLRRVAPGRAPRGAPGDELRRRDGGEVHRGDRLEAGRHLHRQRSSRRGGARGGTCHRRALPGTEPPARGAFDHQAARIARPARARRRGGAVHEEPDRDRIRDRDRPRRDGGGGARPGRVGHGPGERPDGGHAAGRADGGILRDGRVA